MDSIEKKLKKNTVLFLILSKLLKKTYFFLKIIKFIKLWEYWSNLQFSYEIKKSYMEKIMRMMLEEVIMLGIHMLDGQMHPLSQHFFNTEKVRLN